MQNVPYRLLLSSYKELKAPSMNRAHKIEPENLKMSEFFFQQ